MEVQLQNLCTVPTLLPTLTRCPATVCSSNGNMSTFSKENYQNWFLRTELTYLTFRSIMPSTVCYRAKETIHAPPSSSRLYTPSCSALPHYSHSLSLAFQSVSADQEKFQVVQYYSLKWLPVALELNDFSNPESPLVTASLSGWMVCHIMAAVER